MLLLEPDALADLARSEQARCVRAELERATADLRARIIVIAGPPASGKSTFAQILASVLGIRYVLCVDHVRVLAGTLGASEDLQFPTYEAWRIGGAQESRKNHIIGFLKQCASVRECLTPLIAYFEQSVQHVIIEGVHLWPPEIGPLLNSSNMKWVGTVLEPPIQRALEELLAERAKTTFMRRRPDQYPEGASNRLRTMYKFWRSHPFEGNWTRIPNTGDARTVAESLLSAVKVQITA